MKAQVAVEYVIILGVVLVALIPIFYYTISESNRTTRINQASDTVNTLARKAESLYALGAGSRDYVWISVPSGINASLVDNGTISLSFSDLGDVAAFVRINVTGIIPTSQGTHRVSVEMLENVVVIGPVNDTFPPEIIGVSPTGTVRISNPTLSATTNEPALCRYSTSDTGYNSMASQMDGTGLSHTYTLSGLTNNDYSFYARCIDRFGNVMLSSALINFTVILDTSAPVVVNTRVSNASVGVGDYVCVNATVTDDAALSAVWALFSTPLDAPFPSTISYAMSDTASCAGSAGDNVYGVNVQMQAAGRWYINTTFANDTAGNTGFQNPYPNIEVLVFSFQGFPEGGFFEYFPVDRGLYYSTSGLLSYTKPDSGMSTLTDFTLGLTDEDIQTPPASANIRYSKPTQEYQGFILQLNASKNQYRRFMLRLKIKDLDVIPYRITVYAYNADYNNIILSSGRSYELYNEIIPGENRGLNEIPITEVVQAGNTDFIKVRVVPTESMDRLSAYVKEADIGLAR